MNPSFLHRRIIANNHFYGISRQALAEELKSKPGKLFPLQCDLSNQNDILRTLEWIEKNLGAVDILVNNAAINIDITLQTGEMEDWKKIFDVNILGLTCMTKEVLKLMKKKGKYPLQCRIINKILLQCRKCNCYLYSSTVLHPGIDNGIIVNINDICGLKVPTTCDRPVSPAYIASKFALTALTECLRSELALLESNIKVIVCLQGNSVLLRKEFR